MTERAHTTDIAQIAHTAPVEELLGRFGPHAREGLSAEQIPALREAYGENKLVEEKHPGPLRKFLRQMKDTMVIILIVAAAISFAVAVIEGTGEYIDAIIILAIVVLNGVLGVVQESRAERALDALQDLSAPTAKVLREGRVDRIPAAELLPGDVVFLEAGDLVPADGRILEGASLRCEESALTGESLPVEKDAGAVVEADAPLGDRKNMVYAGCSVGYGRALVLVTATGMNSEMGKIAGLLAAAKPEATPLQQKLGQLGKYLGILAIGICALIFALGIFRGMDPLVMFVTAVSLAVAAIPEGLTAVVTVVLAIGVQRMVARGAIIRRLPAVETLGSASVICSDKTGTLTQNRMTAQKVYAQGCEITELPGPLDERAQKVLQLGALCNDGRIEVDLDGEERAIGDPTETAIVAAAKHAGMEKSALEEQFPRVAEIPFDSDRKRMTTVHMVGGRALAIVKGGFDVLAPLCTSIDLAKAEAANLSMAGDALRVLAVACKELAAPPEHPESAELERDLTFIGLIGLIDPPRKETVEAVALCRHAGIKTVMITGDHAATAAAIAEQIGILAEGGETITGQELAKMSDQQLEERAGRYRVYARVSPEDKIRIVRALQARGEVVAMTGDGVNDAPALKAADIGCAMGITGTDVAKSAADMVLTDDNFSTIVEAVRSGRGIYDNIIKTVQFLLGSNLGEVFAVLVAMLLGWGAPLLAIHLLLINIITDALPALALGVEPVEERIMDRKPVPKGQGIFADGLGLIIALQGIMIGVLTLIGYYIGCFVDLSAAHPHSHEAGMTMAFLVLALGQLTQAINCRSRGSIFELGFSGNKQMLWAVAGSAAVVTAICLIPPIERIFRMVDLSMYHWMVVIGLSLAPLLIVETAKLIGPKLLASVRGRR